MTDPAGGLADLHRRLDRGLRAIGVRGENRRYTPHVTLARLGHLTVDQASTGPAVDQFGRCSDAHFYATGNLLHPADSAGHCWREGVQTAGYVTRDLLGELPPPESAIPIQTVSPVIHYTVPQRLVPEPAGQRPLSVSVRFAAEASGRLTASGNTASVTSRRIRALPERRGALRIAPNLLQDSEHAIAIDFV